MLVKVMLHSNTVTFYRCSAASLLINTLKLRDDIFIKMEVFVKKRIKFPTLLQS